MTTEMIVKWLKRMTVLSTLFHQSVLLNWFKYWIMEKKKYIIEAWAEVEYLEYRTYEIEAESEEDAKERFEEDGLIIDTIESDCDTHSVRL